MFRSCKAPPAAVSAEVPCLEMRTYLGERDLLLVLRLHQTCVEPRFHRAWLAAMVAMFNECTAETAAKLERALAAGGGVRLRTVAPSLRGRLLGNILFRIRQSWGARSRPAAGCTRAL